MTKVLGTDGTHCPFVVVVTDDVAYLEAIGAAFDVAAFAVAAANAAVTATMRP